MVVVSLLEIYSWISYYIAAEGSNNYLAGQGEYCGHYLILCIAHYGAFMALESC